jgi:hypothetical protein
MHMAERLHQRKAIEQPARASRPVIGLEDDIAVHPRDFAAAHRQGPQCHVQQSFLLPHDIAAAELDENVRIFLGQLEISAVRQFDRQ